VTATIEQTSRIVAIEPRHARATAAVLYRSFEALYKYHRFPGAYPSVEFAESIARGLIDNPAIWGVAALSGDRLVGSGFLDERGPVKAIGPVSVDPLAQGGGIGRRLTEALLERAADAADVRLLQDSFNRTSMALYVSLGLQVRESVVLLAGRPRSGPDGSVEVRPLGPADLGECEQLYADVHGHERATEIRDSLSDPLCAPLVALRQGKVVAYATTLTYFPAAHAVACTDADLQQLILGAAEMLGRPLSFLLPTHQSALLRWCGDERLRIVKPMTYLSLNDYQRPEGPWLPSTMY
jgi:GNAT superfamily N-acetyltransferase